MPDTDLTSHHVAAHKFVATLEPEDVEWLQRHAIAEEYRAADVIFEAGAPADAFYLVRTGLVALRLGEDRKPGRIVQTVSEGAALGWSWLYPPYEWQFTAEARSVVRLVRFPAERLRTEFAKNPSFGYRLVARLAETMAQRLHHARTQLQDLSHG
jgi:CRP/FNR family cyclic AMP-dependent transcriptional regulator